MMTEADRSNVDYTLLRAREAATRSDQPANDAGLGFVITPEEIAAVAQIAGSLSSSGIGKNPAKEKYKQVDQQTDKLAAIYGMDIISGSQQIGIDPNVVAGHISWYLNERHITLSPAQILAAAPVASKPSSLGSLKPYLPYIVVAAFAFYYMQNKG